MKNVFGINSENENDQIDGANLIIRKVSDETSQEIEKYQNDITAIDEKASPSKISKYIKLIAYFVIMISSLFVIKSFMKKEFLEALKENIIFFVLIVVSAITMGVLTIIDNKKLKKIINSESVKEINDKGEEIQKKHDEELKIPEETINIDVLANAYKVVGGVNKPVSNVFDYVALDAQVFVENKNLCFVLDGAVIGIDIDSIKVVKHNKKIKTAGWNKEEKYNKGEYSKYHIRTDQMGLFNFKFYYALEFNADFVDYEILIPVYDIDNLLKLIDKDIIDSHIKEV